MKQTKLLTTKELCEKLKVDRTTVWRWRKDGLPVVRLNKSIRFDELQVMTWLEMQGNNKMIRLFQDVYGNMKHYIRFEIDGRVTDHEFNNTMEMVKFLSEEEPKLPEQANIYIANDYTIAKAELLESK